MHCLLQTNSFVVLSLVYMPLTTTTVIALT